MDPAFGGANGSFSTTGVRLAPLGAGTLVKRLAKGGQKPTAVLLRALRRLRVFLAAQPADLRCGYIKALSEPLRRALLMFAERNPTPGSRVTCTASQQQCRIHVRSGIR